MARRAAIILAAGAGTRMKSDLPKVLHAVGGRALLDWAAATASALGCERRVAVIGAGAPALREAAEKALGPEGVAVQDPPRGTADAVKSAAAVLAGFEGDVAILYGDAPLVRPETLEALFARRAPKGISLLGFRPKNPAGYGRLILADDGSVARIVEERDATDQERKVGLCNAGPLVADAKTLFQLISMVGNTNKKGEFYLTDVIGLGRSAGFLTHVVEADETEVLGVNSRAELAEAEAAFQTRARQAAMEAGVTLIDPATVYFSHDTLIEPDVIVEPNVFFGLGVTVRRGARIHAFCHFERTEIGERCEIGPFARFRPGAKLAKKVKVGNFVEVKNSVFAEGAKASHLSYIGDADVGARANIGAGTITCNYDGFFKDRTVIGEDAFIGSDTALVAPVKVGARANTAAGSVIVEDVPDGALGIARGRQAVIDGWADRYRARRAAEKAAKVPRKDNAKESE
ncbi:MAG: bifunctional UDP-N-acetylglucosamine diphosphorylase/glucosamine-1-phosphate N-acetyltransferase GlmU [Hyphomonadaceae bacterium]|nr:bifunctional UDP-N-acetylglucosamine diphosphorylase/glucosamine-1-phosphate N-acetyltransferase GlmU [Hyphomonadaceae bacterium]